MGRLRTRQRGYQRRPRALNRRPGSLGRGLRAPPVTDEPRQAVTPTPITGHCPAICHWPSAICYLAIRSRLTAKTSPPPSPCAPAPSRTSAAFARLNPRATSAAVTADAILVRIHLQHVLRPIRIVLHCRQVAPPALSSAWGRQRATLPQTASRPGSQRVGMELGIGHSGTLSPS